MSVVSLLSLKNRAGWNSGRNRPMPVRHLDVINSARLTKEKRKIAPFGDLPE
jgi:hypothetical protein